MRECSIDVEEQGDVDILRLNGSLDAYSFPRLETTLNQLRDSKRHRVILDCSGSNEVAAKYAQWLAAGIHVITPNKQAGAGPIEDQQRTPVLGEVATQRYGRRVVLFAASAVDDESAFSESR